MSNIKVISLFDDPELLIASGKRVFSKAESGALLDLQDTVQRIRAKEDNVDEKLKSAEALACKRGRGEGLAQGRQHAGDELAAKLLQLEQQNEIYRQSIRDEVTKLALEVVRKVASNVAPQAMLAALATEAAAEHLPRQAVTLKVHPDHLESVRQRVEEIKNTDSAALIENITADNELSASDCILETPNGQICVDLETQLLAIEQHLLAVAPVSPIAATA